MALPNKRDLTELFDILGEGSSQLKEGSFTINAHGHPGVGKTTSAFKASKYWPRDMEAHLENYKKTGKKLFLKDLLQIEIDNEGSSCVHPFRIRPGFILHFRDLLFKNKGDVFNTMADVADGIVAMVKKHPEIRVVVHDTITEMDDLLESFCFRMENAELSRDKITGEVFIDGQRTYGKMKRVHQEYRNTVLCVPNHVSNIFLFHQKDISPPPNKVDIVSKKAMEKKQLLLKMGDQNVTLVPAITGNSLLSYLRTCSLQLVCVKTQKGRFIYPATYSEQLGKNRFESVLEGKQDPDIGKILEKVREACK
jgi:hypothetical protein